MSQAITAYVLLAYPHAIRRPYPCCISMDETYSDGKLHPALLSLDPSAVSGESSYVIVGGRKHAEKELDLSRMTLDESLGKSGAPILWVTLVKRCDDWDAMPIASWAWNRDDCNQKTMIRHWGDCIDAGNNSTKGRTTLLTADGWPN